MLRWNIAGVISNVQISLNLAKNQRNRDNVIDLLKWSLHNFMSKFNTWNHAEYEKFWQQPHFMPEANFDIADLKNSRNRVNFAFQEDLLLNCSFLKGGRDKNNINEQNFKQIGLFWKMRVFFGL